MTEYGLAMKYANDFEPADYLESEVPEDLIMNKGCEILEKNLELLEELAEKYAEYVIHIPGHERRCVYELSRELLAGKHNKNFAYMQRAFLEGIVSADKNLQECAKELIFEDKYYYGDF